MLGIGAFKQRLPAAADALPGRDTPVPLNDRHFVNGRSLTEVPAGVDEARQLLLVRLVRCAEAGKLNTTPDEAAQIMMAACIGVALSLITQPNTFSHPDLSYRVRDAVLGEMLVEAPTANRHGDALKSTALQMAALIRAKPTPLIGPEVSMMLQWLGEIASSEATATPSRSRGAVRGQRR